MTKFSNIGFKDTPNFDSFSRLRVSSAHSLFDAQFTYNLQPLLYGQLVTGANATLTHDTVNRNALFTFASSPIASEVKMQTFEHFRYTAGRSQLIFMSLNFNGGVANTIKYAGYSDGTEGIELRMNGLAPQICILSTTAEGNNIVEQTNWNYDKLDGTGVSGLTIDFTKAQILVIDLQSLYAGRVRVGFDIGGQIVWAHHFNHSNMSVKPYFKTANLPLRAGMTSSATVTTTMVFICASVISENGEVLSEGFDFSTSGSATAASGARTHLLSVQPKLLFNSIQNRVKFILQDLTILVTGANPVKWELCLGDVITGTTAFIDANTSHSAIEYNTLGTTSGAPEIVIASGYVGATLQSKSSVSLNVPMKYPITLDMAGLARSLGRLSLIVTGIGGVSACVGSVTWKEIR